MRPKFLMVLAAVTALILTAVFLLRSHPQGIQLPVTAVTPQAPANRLEATSSRLTAMVVRPDLQPSAEEERLAISQQIQQMQTWAQTDGASGLTSIMSELTTNSEIKVRLAAVTLAKQSGNREIIPALKEAADRTEDLKEKKALLDAAEFLAQPTVDEQGVMLQSMVAAAQ